MIEKGWGREGPQPALQNIQEFKSPPCAVSPHLEAQPAESGDRGCWLKVERFPTFPQSALLLLPLLLQLIQRTVSPDGAGCSAPAARGPKSSKPSRNCHHSSATKTTDDHHHCRHYFNFVLYMSSRLHKGFIIPKVLKIVLKKVLKKVVFLKKVLKRNKCAQKSAQKR